MCLKYILDVRGVDKAAECKLNASEKSDIHLKIASNGHGHKLYQPRWVKE